MRNYRVLKAKTLKIRITEIKYEEDKSADGKEQNVTTDILAINGSNTTNKGYFLTRYKSKNNNTLFVRQRV